jgi:PhnB protein
MAVSPIPAGYAGITPYLIVRDAGRAIEFYKDAFGATEVLRMDEPGGKVAHAELKIGEGIFMMAEETPDLGYKGPLSYGGSPVGLMFYVPNVDEVFERALKGGAESKRPVADQFYGDRNGVLVDPFGHQWTIATHVRDVSPEEMEQAMAQQGNEGPSS